MRDWSAYEQSYECGIRHDATELYAVAKSASGMMLGVSGGLKFGNLDNEDSGEGLDEFFNAVESVESELKADRIVFLMDMKTSVAHRILEKWNDRAIIVMQSHRIWGDVFVYFHRERWYTLHLRTDAFSEVSVKRDETLLLPPGIVELYEGIKGVTHRNPLRRLSENELEKLALDRIGQIRTVDWEASGRVDFVMAGRMRDFNAILKELMRRRSDTGPLVCEIGQVMSSLKEKYRRRINRAVKRKIVNAWRPFSILRDRVDELSMELLGETVPEPPPRRNANTGERNIRLSPPPRLMYRGPPDQGPQELAWISGLMETLFSG